MRGKAALLLLFFSLPPLAAQESRPIVLIVPPQSRAIVVPVAVSLPASFAPRQGQGWQLVEGALRIHAQAEDSTGKLHFLLPVAASKTEVKRTLRLERLPPAAEPAFRLEESEEKFLHVREAEAPVLTYNVGMILKPGVREDRRRSSYVHPLYAPDGTLLTDDFPADHLHHRGLSWMWPNVEVAGERHSLWDIRGVRQRFERWLEKTAGPVFARVGVENGWYTGEKKVARERVEFLIYRATPEGRAVDATLIFEATDRPVTLTGELPDRKGYGGLCLRFAPRRQTVITTPAGAQEKDSNLVPFPWADLSARFAPSERAAGAAIFVHAQNSGFPNGWTLRPYGFLGVAWPGMQPVVLEPGRPVTLRYRLWLHAGDAEQAAVAAHYAAYADPPRAARR